MKTYYKKVQFWLYSQPAPNCEPYNYPLTDWINEEDMTEEWYNKLQKRANNMWGEVYKKEKYIEVDTEENKI